jgi:hypothetical protein
METSSLDSEGFLRVPHPHPPEIAIRPTLETAGPYNGHFAAATSLRPTVVRATGSAPVATLRRRGKPALHMATHLAPFFKTLDRVTSESAMDYRRARLRVVQRATLLKELSCLRGFMNWCKGKKYVSEVPIIESPGEKVTDTVDQTKRHKSEPVPLDQTEAFAIIENRPNLPRGLGRDRHATACATPSSSGGKPRYVP